MSNQRGNVWANRAAASGRGRGSQQPVRAAQQPQNGSSHLARQNPRNNASSTNHGNKPQVEKKPARNFEEACAEIQANVQKYLEKANIIDDSTDSSDDDTAPDSQLVSSLLKSYLTKGSEDSKKTQDLLSEALKSNNNVCLICIGSVKKTDATWNCNGCYCSLHLNCVQRWAKDSVFGQAEAAQENQMPGQVAVKKTFLWSCPKCRKEFPESSIPTRYICYCEKVVDPPLDPWLIPHSCGQSCQKPLKPECSHLCLLLCHPGPCPPCPQTVSVSCLCGQSNPQPRRCSSKAWTCAKQCKRTLACGQHQCEAICHAGECPPCPRRSKQSCRCGKRYEERLCTEKDFQCDKVCGKPFSCGHHFCDVTCHSGKCGPCPMSLQRTCPCGKKVVTLPCTVEVSPCGDTCGKVLECGLHFCAERCHKGKCGTCLQMRVQRCRCGVKEKELPCYKSFTCETKCKLIKDCRRHPCNRKCCPGNCPPCEQTCNRPLSCKNHKCISRCHQGPCYPCPLTVDVLCACGTTRITVPCGSEKYTKPPKCSQVCKQAPDCHHPSREKHACHFGDCPPCRQICRESFPSCGHSCPAPCHDAVAVKIQPPSITPRAGPWEVAPAPRIEIRKLPCPPCQVPMPVTCLGGHETCDWPCHIAQPTSCQRPCGRLLACTNHSCAKACHRVENAPNDLQAGSNCETCESACLKARPPGCQHPCPKPCHPGSCPPCNKLGKHNCHCGLNPQFIRCHEWTAADEAAKEVLLSCKDRCPRLLACGHRCPKLCHSGACPALNICEEVVVVRCACKRIKTSHKCHFGAPPPLCDSVCQAKLSQEQKAQAEKELLKKAEEEEKAQEEYERYVRKFGPRKKERRREQHVPDNHSPGITTLRLAVLSSLVLASAALFTYVYVS